MKEREYSIVKSIHDPQLLQVVEDGLRLFEGNRYQCNVWIDCRRAGWDLINASAAATRRKSRPYKTVKIYLD